MMRFLLLLFLLLNLANAVSFRRAPKGEVAPAVPFRLNCSDTTAKEAQVTPHNTSTAALSARNPEDCIEGGSGSGYAGAAGLLQSQGRTQECQQCYTSCASEDEAFNQCLSAYYLTCDAGKKALSFCRCEQGGWDYPYMNPGGRTGGQFSWKCCFFHKCMKE